MKTTTHVFAASLVFLNMATLTKHCILQHENYFFIFRVFALFLKKIVKKRAPKSTPHFSLKNHPKVVPGDPFWDPKRSRINVGEVKKPKNCVKKSILDTIDFFRKKKSNKGPTKVQPGSVLVRRAFGPVPHGRLLLIGFILRIYSKNTF